MSDNSRIAQAAKTLGNIAWGTVHILSRDIGAADALDMAARAAVGNAINANKRTGIYEREMTTTELDEIGFLGAVAEDVLNGEVERPSVGNVRAYALTFATATS